MTQHRQTGRVADSLHARSALRSTAFYRARDEMALRTVIQPWAGPTDQQNKPSCVGHAIRGRVRSLTTHDLSAVDLWTDARRLDGALVNPMAGTTASSAIASLTRRGASPYRDGEDLRSTDSDVAQCDLRSDLAADAHRLPVGFRHSTIWGSVDSMRLEVIDALAAGMAVVVGAGRKQPYFTAPRGLVLDGTYWGGSKNGHEEGLFGYIDTLDAFCVAGSWGSLFAGFRHEGVDYPGCTVVDAATLLSESWDVDCFEVTNL